jgi:hypothetical protein
MAAAIRPPQVTRAPEGTERVLAPMRGNTRINVNVPNVLASAVEAIAEEQGITRTDVIVRALSREAYFARLAAEAPDARVISCKHGSPRLPRPPTPR